MEEKKVEKRKNQTKKRIRKWKIIEEEHKGRNKSKKRKKRRK